MVCGVPRTLLPFDCAQANARYTYTVRTVCHTLCLMCAAHD